MIIIFNQVKKTIIAIRHEFFIMRQQSKQQTQVSYKLTKHIEAKLIKQWWSPSHPFDLLQTFCFSRMGHGCSGWIYHSTARKPSIHYYHLCMQHDIKIFSFCSTYRFCNVGWWFCFTFKALIFQKKCLDRMWTGLKMFCCIFGKKGRRAAFKCWVLFVCLFVTF